MIVTLRTMLFKSFVSTVVETVPFCLPLSKDMLNRARLQIWTKSKSSPVWNSMSMAWKSTTIHALIAVQDWIC